MISAKQINNLISQDKFDAEAAMKKVSELETLVAQAKEADKSGMNFSFINSAGQYQLEAKKYVRRIRDKVPYSDWDKEQLQDANSSWMAEDSFPRALCDYNEMVDEIFQSIVIAERVCDERGYVTKSWQYKAEWRINFVNKVSLFNDFVNVKMSQIICLSVIYICGLWVSVNHI